MPHAVDPCPACGGLGTIAGHSPHRDVPPPRKTCQKCGGTGLVKSGGSNSLISHLPRKPR